MWLLFLSGFFLGGGGGYILRDGVYNECVGIFRSEIFLIHFEYHFWFQLIFS